MSVLCTTILPRREGAVLLPLAFHNHPAAALSLDSFSIGKLNLYWFGWHVVCLFRTSQWHNIGKPNQWVTIYLDSSLAHRTVQVRVLGDIPKIHTMFTEGDGTSGCVVSSGIWHSGSVSKVKIWHCHISQNKINFCIRKQAQVLHSCLILLKIAFRIKPKEDVDSILCWSKVCRWPRLHGHLFSTSR